MFGYKKISDRIFKAVANTMAQAVLELKESIKSLTGLAEFAHTRITKHLGEYNVRMPLMLRDIEKTKASIQSVKDNYANLRLAYEKFGGIYDKNIISTVETQGKIDQNFKMLNEKIDLVINHLKLEYAPKHFDVNTVEAVLVKAKKKR